MNKLMRKFSIICISIITSIIFLDYNYSLSGINTMFALLYVIVVFFTTIWATFMFLQNILGTNTPFEINASKLLSLIHSPVYKTNINIVSKSTKPIDERIQNFVDDIEEICIKKWYLNYISQDEHFLIECSKLIDIVVRRFLQVAGQINSEKVLHGMVTILLRHVKEYKKAVKKAKIGGCVEGHYRYAHVGSQSEKAFEHFVLQITSKTLRNFIHWELYNSLACRCLNAILARKLISYLIHHLSSPGIINYKVLLMVDQQDKYLMYQMVSIGDVDHSMIETLQSDDIMDNSVHENDENLWQETNESQKTNESVVVNTEETDAIDCVDGKLNEDTTEDKVEVRVYESRSANKTWRNSSDLDCISLGQDILFLSNIAEEDVSKPDWDKISEEYGKKEKFRVQPVAQSVVATAATASALVTNIKPATSTASSVKDTMKDLQQSTSNAMHKIEDEAAGVVEGILDLGMAGIRKGLRLTGLQDNVHEHRPKSESKDIPKSNKIRLAKLSHVHSDEDEKFMGKLCKKVKQEEDEEFDDIYVNPLHNKFQEAITPGYEGDILLEKSPMIETRTSSNESTIPTMEFVHIEDSPDPEYEDNPDLATTTAKLRSLLALKTEANTPLASPMSLIPTPLDASGSSSIDELSEVDTAIPSMYKAWAKTATGVFQNTLNTLKTALPGNANEDIHEGIDGTPSRKNATMYNGDDIWSFVGEDVNDSDFNVVLEKFLAERQQFCTVDKAFEAVETIDLHDQIEGSFLLQHDRKYEDELDEFDTKIPISKALMDLICELIEETYPPLVKENIVKTILLVYGTVVEEKLQTFAEQMIRCVSQSIGHLPKFASAQVAMSMTMDEFMEPIVKALIQVLTQSITSIIDTTALTTILRLITESLQSHKVNVDTSLLLLELFVSEVITACNQSSPSYSV